MDCDVDKSEHKDAKQVEIRKNMHVTISNNFIMHHCWSFRNAAAAKLILTLIGFADYDNDENFCTTRCWARDLAHFIGVKDRSWSTDIRRIIVAACKEYINDGDNRISWFNFVYYDEKTQDIVWQINTDLKMFFLNTYNMVYIDSQKKVGYVNVKLEECMKFRHSYSLRVYFLAMIYAGYKGKLYGVEEFVSLLDLPRSYAKYGLLRVDILDKAIEDICNCTNLQIRIYVDNYKYKRANKVIKFKLMSNFRTHDCEASIAGDVVGDSIDVNVENGTNDGNASEAENLLRQYLKDEKTIKRLVNNYDFNRIKRNVEYGKQAHSKNGAGYGLIVKAIENDYAAGNPRYMTFDEQQQLFYQQLGISDDVCPL